MNLCNITYSPLNSLPVWITALIAYGGLLVACGLFAYGKIKKLKHETKQLQENDLYEHSDC